MPGRKGRFRTKAKTSMNTEEQYTYMRALWMLRALVRSNAFDEFMDSRRYNEKPIMGAMGLDPLTESQNEDSQFIFGILERELDHLEHRYPEYSRKKCILTENVRNLGEKIGLSDEEMQILSFLLVVCNEEVLSDALDDLGNISSSTMFKAISVITEIDLKTVQNSLNRYSSLHSSGLVKLDNSIGHFSHKFKVLEGLDDVILCDNTTAEELLNSYFKELSPTLLRLDDFPQFEKDIELMVALLSQAQKSIEAGINILFYGKPGTGKTELAKAILKCVSNKMYSINLEDADGDSCSSFQRLSSYQLCQQLLRRNPSCVIFDEVEDVFVDSDLSPFFGSRPKSQKGWINSILEQNPSPTVWICNSVRSFDEAFLRRFSYSLKFETPPRMVRERVVKQHMKGICISDKLIQKLSKNDALTPSQISSAARTARLVGESTSLSIEEVIEMTINQSQQLKGSKKRALTKGKSQLEYSLEYLNTSTDVRQLKSGLKSNPTARILLYGPPGTGKTQYVRYLADTMDLPLIEAGGSDLLDPFVGGTEQKIAECFEKATKDECILLMDEIDSLLWNRESAVRSWEVSGVNELLRQMQDFDGILFACSNMMKKFDKASIRRFDLKVEFGYLDSQQVTQILKKLVNEQGGRVMKKNLQYLAPRISRLTNLSPGDFALLARQFRFQNGDINLETVIGKLEQESQIKEGSKRTIGF